MNLTKFVKILFTLLTGAFLTAILSADVIGTKNGSKLSGKVVSIDGTHVVLDTDFAGEIKIKQSEVESITTDGPLNVRLASGTVLEGAIGASAAPGDVHIAGKDGGVNTTVDKLAMTWTPGAIDPAVAALQRKWAYEAAADITGKTGNSEQLGMALQFRATLASSFDTLQFYTAYERQVTDHEKSSDQFKAGLDYQNNFAGRYSWYVRDEGGFDRVKDIDLYNVAAAGVGYDILKTKVDTLTGRVGLAYRYENYGDPLAEDLDSVGLDIGLNNQLTMNNWSMTNRISYVPAFDDFANYRFYHESYIELPLKIGWWKLRIGVSNDYNSKPPAGYEKLDTTYFTRLVLNWK
ncbi:hypothetical protein AW736_11050 [Termitidicoccus mucosus]|uniref:DUF481 domain-containing protein n=1 Tax=Termitidicoccus mucosus TaxID=1184151 RepID=A0A178IKY4_9BACT|nr:hypothetical protein AW736_11050 [Opitutaceae bacterium TSB47]